MVKLAHVCIETDDLDKTEAFYNKLGLKKQFEFRNNDDELIGMYLAFSDNTFLEVIKVLKPREEGAVRHFAIEVDDIEETHTQLSKKGVDVSEKKLGVDKTWMITTRDPNNIFIEFHQYTNDSLQQNGGQCLIDYTPK
ncbi:MAG: hypothetical protein DHS20C05_01220 [Hyphococcus sp.]|nr:MAG: hypothetical protein DHS20C05_01220 [Marinicaulis sp.]